MLDTVEMMVTYLTMSCLMRTTARQPTLIEHGNKDEIMARDCLPLNPVLVGRYLSVNGIYCSDQSTQYHSVHHSQGLNMPDRVHIYTETIGNGESLVSLYTMILQTFLSCF